MSPPPAHPTPQQERAAAWLITGVLMAILWVSKTLSGVPLAATVGFTVAMLAQIYLPLRRAEYHQQDLEFVGLTLRGWRTELAMASALAFVFFPLYGVGIHLLLTQGHAIVRDLGMTEAAHLVPPARFVGIAPLEAWLDVPHAANQVFSHTVGVALPEEVFYRGYLQQQLARGWPPKNRLLGVPVGRAWWVAAAVFAFGHFIGEWNPVRLATFFPGLLFGWLVARRGSVVGAIGFHAGCNLFGEFLFSLYEPV